jgi:hypothetical protein
VRRYIYIQREREKREEGDNEYRKKREYKSENKQGEREKSTYLVVSNQIKGGVVRKYSEG